MSSLRWGGMCVIIRSDEGTLDPYYDKVVRPDEESFFDLSSSLLTVGWEETYVDASRGEIAESVVGK